MNHKLEISEDRKRVTKYFDDSEQLQLEVRRSSEAYAICENIDLLCVPRIISSDKRSITFTYFPDASTFADLLMDDYQRAVKLIPFVANSLVYLQNNLVHSSKFCFEHSREMSEDYGTFVHGDFSVHNLLTQHDALILVDWSSSHWGGKQFNHAPEHWDLAWFVLSLYLIPNIRKLPFAQRDFFADNLLNEYLKQGEFSQPRKLVSLALSQHAHFSKYSRRNAKWYSTVKHYPEWYSCRRFWKRALVASPNTP